MGRKIKRLSGLEIDEVSLVDRPANQHGVVAIAKSQEDVMPIYDADGYEVDEEELEHGDFVYDDDGNELVFLADDPGDVMYYDDEDMYESVGKASGNVRSLVGLGAGTGKTTMKPEFAAKVRAARQAKLEAGRGKLAAMRNRPTKGMGHSTPNSRAAGLGETATVNSAAGRLRPQGPMSPTDAVTHMAPEGGYKTGVNVARQGPRSWLRSKGTELGMRWRDPQQAGHLRRNTYIGAGATAAAGAGGVGYSHYKKSLGDEVMESLSKSFTDDDRNEVIAKAMDYVEDVSARNDYLEEAVADIIEDRDVEGYYELAKSYDIPMDPEEIAGLLYRASMVLPEEDVESLDRIFTATGEFSKSYYDEIGYTGGYEYGALGEVYAAAGDVVSKSGAALTQEQAVTALFDANPAAYDEYEAEQRYNR